MVWGRAKTHCLKIVKKWLRDLPNHTNHKNMLFVICRLLSIFCFSGWTLPIFLGGGPLIFPVEELVKYLSDHGVNISSRQACDLDVGLHH